MQRRGLALFLSLALIWSMSASTWAAVNPFSDLKSDHWAYDSVVKLAAAGLVEGYPDGTFGGDRMFTRYEMAMVFARILARFERLIDERIQAGIDVKTADLEAAIQSTRAELTELIEKRHAELHERMQALEAEKAEEAVSASASGVGSTRVESGELTPEARAALSELVADQIAESLQRLNDLDEIARRLQGVEDALEGVDGALAQLERRVLQLEGSTPSRAEAEAIAERVIASALAEHDRDVRAALDAARGDTEALSNLVESRTADLARHIDQLAHEFRPELERLGVRVTALERRMSQAESELAEVKSDVAGVRAQLGTIHFSGELEAELSHTDITGDGPYYLDPRDYDEDDPKVYRRGDRFSNTLRLNIEATPAENVNVKASLVVEDMLGYSSVETDNVDEGDKLKPSFNVLVTTPGVLRSLYLGELDRDHVAEPYDKYTLDAEEFIDEDEEERRQGADVHLVWGQGDSTNLSGFLTRESETNYIFGAAAGYQLSDAMGLTYRVVHQGTNPGAAKGGGVNAESNSTATISAAGVLSGNVEYSATVGVNRKRESGTDSTGRLVDAWATAALPFGEARLDVAAVGAKFDPIFGKELKSGGGGEDRGVDWLERVISPPEDKVAQGEKDVVASLSAPLLGFDTVGRVGMRDDDAGRNVFAQVEVNGSWEGLDMSLLVDRRTDRSDDVDQTIRAVASAPFGDATVGMAVHYRNNDQDWAVVANETRQRTIWMTGEQTFDFGLPLHLGGHFGMNRARDKTAVGVRVGTEYNLGALRLSGGYSVESHAVGALRDLEDEDKGIDFVWWKNSAWDDARRRDIATVGLDYTIENLFGTEWETGYEYKVVRMAGDTYGSARNIFKASFEKILRGGEARLVGEGKYVIGVIGEGLDQEDGNERDLIAKLKLTYPVFNGADLNIGGEYVRSAGSKANEYDVFQLKAGVSMKF